MNWGNYEEIVKNIYETLGKNKGVKVDCYGRNCKCKGKSGVVHQIDILTSHSDGVHIYKTDIECKYWNTKVNKDIVMKVSKIIEDCNIDKGVIVSKMGFTEDAVNFAKQYNIELEILRDLFENSIDKKLESFFEFRTPTPDIHEIRMIIDKNEVNKVKNLKCKFEDLYFLFPDGKIRAIKEIVENVITDKLSQSKIGDILDVYTKFPDGTTLKSHIFDLVIKVEGVKIKGVTKEGVAHWKMERRRL